MNPVRTVHSFSRLNDRVGTDPPSIVVEELTGAILKLDPIFSIDRILTLANNKFMRVNAYKHVRLIFILS